MLYAEMTSLRRGYFFTIIIVSGEACPRIFPHCARLSPARVGVPQARPPARSNELCDIACMFHIHSISEAPWHDNLRLYHATPPLRRQESATRADFAFTFLDIANMKQHTKSKP